MRISETSSPALAPDTPTVHAPKAPDRAASDEKAGSRKPAALVSLRAPTRELLDPAPPDANDTPPGNGEAAQRRRAAESLIGLAVDVRAMTPREAANVGLQLYAAGLVRWEEYAELAFQPELHPDYDATIGALLGEKASPDAPRDFVRQWEERVAYEQRYNAIDSTRVRSTERIARVLGRLAGDGLAIDV